MKTIAVMNQKGGTGKTTSAINLAGELVRRGKKVLLVDMDTQGNATSNLSLTEVPNPTLADVIVSKSATVADTICHTSSENLDLIRGGSLLAPALAAMQADGGTDLAHGGCIMILLNELCDKVQDLFPFIRGARHKNSSFWNARRSLNAVKIFLNRSIAHFAGKSKHMFLNFYSPVRSKLGV